MRRPPRSALSGFASLGRTTSAISDCDSRTARGCISTVMSLIDLSFSAVHLSREIRLQETLSQRLYAHVVVHQRPAIHGDFVVKIAVILRQVIQLRNITDRDLPVAVAQDGKAHRIRSPVRGQPRTIASIAQVTS